MSTHITTVICYFLHFGAKIYGLESKYNNVTAMFYRNQVEICYIIKDKLCFSIKDKS